MLVAIAVAGLAPPAAISAAVGLLTIAIAAGAVRDVLPNSIWRVPRTWGFNGRTRYAGVFGLFLGTGFLTARPGVTFWFLLCASLSAGAGTVAAVAVTFGLTRASWTSLGTLAADTWSSYLTLANLANRIRVLEIVLLVAATGTLLARAIAPVL